MERLIDYQDVAYAHDYLDRLAALHRLDRSQAKPAPDFAFTAEVAKCPALAMAYDDVMRVADLKTRASRFGRVNREMGLKGDQVIHVTEYMHPRLEEIAGMLPATVGRFLEGRPRLYRTLDRVVSRGRRVRTSTVLAVLMPCVVGQSRFLRRGSLRHGREVANIEHWLGVATGQLADNYALAVEVVACRRLIKGYSDTHARGSSTFDRVLAMVPSLATLPDGAGRLRRLRQVALQDETGEGLDGTIQSAYPAAA